MCLVPHVDGTAWWKATPYQIASVPEDLGDMLPGQAPTQKTTHLPMARIAAAMLVDAVKCLGLPREHRMYREAVTYLLGPDNGAPIPCDIACALAGIDRERLKRRLRAAGHGLREGPRTLIVVRCRRRA